MKRILLIHLLFFANHIFAQDTTAISLQDAIAIAENKSPQLAQIKSKSDETLLNYKVYIAGLKPTVILNSSLPNFNKNSYAVRQPDGTINYRFVSQNNSLLGLSISKKFPDGGSLALNTDLSRFDDFRSSFKQYSSSPINVRLNLPLFSHYSRKLENETWKKSLELSEEQFKFSKNLLIHSIIDAYFDLLEAEMTKNLNLQYVLASQKNFDIEQKRIALGTTSDDRVLQLKIQYLNNVNNLYYSKEVYDVNKNNFSNIIPLQDTVYTLKLPMPSDTFTVEALNKRKFIKNNSAFEVQKLNLQKKLNLVRQRSTSNLSLSYGFVNVSENFSDAYSNFRPQQVLSVNLSIPVFDFGKRRSEISLVNHEIEYLELQNKNLNIQGALDEKNARLKFKNLLDRVQVANDLSQSAGERYNLAQQLYRIGKLQIFELNNAQISKDAAAKNLISLLRQLWSVYYQFE